MSRDVISTATNACIFVVAAILVFVQSSSSRADAQVFQKILPTDGAAQDFFGQSIAVSGTMAIVGASNDSHDGVRTGSAYLFDVTTGQQLAKLVPQDGADGDLFGWSVAIHENTAIVGALRSRHDGFQSGAAYLFDVTTGAQIAKLIPNDLAPLDEFGWSVDINGSSAIVGSTHHAGKGAAYIFDLASGSQTRKLQPGDVESQDEFGWAVALSGSNVLVSSIADDDEGFDAGAIYLFDAPSGAQKFKIGSPNHRQNFGMSIDIDGSTAIVGQLGGGDLSGSAFLFDLSTGSLIAELVSDDRVSRDRFSWSVGLSGSTAIVGAAANESAGVISGAAYLFDMDGRQTDKLVASDPLHGSGFGRTLAISGNYLVIGANQHNANGENSGAAYVFVVPEPACAHLALLLCTAWLLARPPVRLPTTFGQWRVFSLRR